jgi:hypothetical protein
MADEDVPTYFRPLRERLLDAASKDAASEEAESTDTETLEPVTEDEHPGTPEWPAWAVVDWEQLESGSGGTKLRGLSDIAVPVAPKPAEPEQAIPLPAKSPLRAEPPLRAEGPLKAELVEAPSGSDSMLSLPSMRLAELLREAAFAAQEARERAARAEGEAAVLRRELERERAERAELTLLLSRRRRWFRRDP